MSEPRDTSADLAEGRIVRSTAGRDKGTLYVVVGHEGDRYVLVADGRKRTVRRPKRKNARHLQATAWQDDRLVRSLAGGRPPGDADVRAALGAIMERAQEDAGAGRAAGERAGPEGPEPRVKGGGRTDGT